MPAKSCYDGGTCRNDILVEDLEIEVLNLKSKIEVLQAKVDDLLKACEAALIHLEHAEFDYTNGNIAPDGTDEGNYYGWKIHGELISQLTIAITKVRGKN